MNAYYLYDGTNSPELMQFPTDEEAFREAQNRNRRTRGAPWRAYDERGNMIVGVCIMNQNPGVEFTAWI